MRENMKNPRQRLQREEDTDEDAKYEDLVAVTQEPTTRVKKKKKNIVVAPQEPTKKNK
jgi:hypothetical protein